MGRADVSCIKDMLTRNIDEATFLACAAPFHVRKKKTEPARAPLVSLTSIPMQARDYLVFDWPSMVLWCSYSKPK